MTNKLIISWLLIISFSTLGNAQQDSLNLFEYLYGEAIPHFHIKTNLKQIIREKAKKENHVGNLTFKDKNGTPQEFNIKIRARGNMRNKVCSLPPLKIDFKMSDLAAMGINGKFDDLKLVVRCKSNDSYENYLLKEYLTYKLYNTLTDVSFRVQLIKLTLEDNNGKTKNIEAYAFLIESIEELAKRVNATVRKNLTFQDKHIDPFSYDRMCLFQFMIGNADWHLFKQHNTKIVILNEQNIVASIPYDFDFSAIVSTPYATPHTKLPIYHIAQRYYLGSCREQKDHLRIFDFFKEKKIEILSTVEQFGLLPKREKKSMLKYLNGFFKILDNPKAAKKQIIKHCDLHVKIK